MTCFLTQLAIDLIFEEAHTERVGALTEEMVLHADREAYWSSLLSTPEEAQS